MIWRSCEILESCCQSDQMMLTLINVCVRQLHNFTLWSEWQLPKETQEYCGRGRNNNYCFTYLQLKISFLFCPKLLVVQTIVYTFHVLVGPSIPLKLLGPSATVLNSSHFLANVIRIHNWLLLIFLHSLFYTPLKISVWAFVSAPVASCTIVVFFDVPPNLSVDSINHTGGIILDFCKK